MQPNLRWLLTLDSFSVFSYQSRTDAISTISLSAGELTPFCCQSAFKFLIGWEWLQRETDIFATFMVEHYRPKDRPNMVRVVDEKTEAESWVPLFDDDGLA